VYLAVLPALPSHAQADESVIAGDLRCCSPLSGWVLDWLAHVLANAEVAVAMNCCMAERHMSPCCDSMADQCN
jgi:hypothetical protein